MFVGRRLLHAARVLQEGHYDALHLHHSATAKEIKSAFKTLSLKLHPDILKSQKLTGEELEDLNDKYLKIKKSYEVLSDPQQKSQYDLKMGHVRANTQASEFVRKMNSFHYSHAPNQGDVPHFDEKKHYERNERMERRFRMKMADHSSDVFGQNIYHRKMSGRGPRKDIYHQYKPQRVDDSGRKSFLRLLLGVGGMALAFYLIKGSLTSQRIQQEREKHPPRATKREPMRVNNEYGKRLVKQQSQDRPKLEDQTFTDKPLSKDQPT